MAHHVTRAMTVNELKTTGAGAKRKASQELLGHASVASSDTSTRPVKRTRNTVKNKTTPLQKVISNKTTELQEWHKAYDAEWYKKDTPKRAAVKTKVKIIKEVPGFDKGPGFGVNTKTNNKVAKKPVVVLNFKDWLKEAADKTKAEMHATQECAEAMVMLKTGMPAPEVAEAASILLEMVTRVMVPGEHFIEETTTACVLGPKTATFDNKTAGPTHAKPTAPLLAAPITKKKVMFKEYLAKAAAAKEQD